MFISCFFIFRKTENSFALLSNSQYKGEPQSLVSELKQAQTALTQYQETYGYFTGDPLTKIIEGKDAIISDLEIKLDFHEKVSNQSDMICLCLTSPNKCL